MNAPVIVSLRTRLLDLPLKRPFRAPTVQVSRVQLVLIDLDCGDGLLGRAYLHAFPGGLAPVFRQILTLIGAHLKGAPLDPEALHGRILHGLGLFAGFEGLLASALGGFDMAAWDAFAKLQGHPLATVLGGTLELLPAYNSCGLGFSPPAALADEAVELLEGGFTALKMRLGHPDVRDDLAAVRAIRRAVPDHVHLMADYAQAYRTVEAGLERLRALDGEGLYWIEDPVIHDDFDGHARIAGELRTPIQTGENLYSAAAVRRAVAHGAADMLNFDLQHIGGVTGWRRAAAETGTLPLSSHIYPEFSRHTLAATPNRHWLEHFDWAAPVLCDPVTVRDGHAAIPEVAGAGIEWNEDAIARHLVLDAT
jgi:mandelate racemase